MANRGRSAALIMCLIVASSLAGAACAPPFNQPCATNPHRSEAGLCIDRMTASETGSRDIAVRATIGSVLGTVEAGKVWWVLAPLGPGNPWDRAIFRSRVDKRQYSPNQSVSLALDSSVAVPSAFYDLALIVHRVNANGSETHADETTLPPIYIEAPPIQPWLIRHEPATGPVVVVSVSGRQPDRGGVHPLSRAVAIANQGTTSQNFSAWLEARTSLTGWEGRWWLGQATLYVTKPVTGRVLGGHSETIQIDASAPADLLASFPDSQYWLVVTTGEKVSDQILVDGLDVLPSAGPTRLSRPDPPRGPVELAAISDPNNWNNTTTPKVTLTLSNLTGSPQAVQAFWYLAAPHDQRPWADAKVYSARVQITLGPWATEAVVVGADRPAPAGQGQISAWVHYRTTSGGYAHSDGLWLAQPITVT
jgi:hypothetical protein